MRVEQTSVIHLVAQILMTLVGFLGNVYFAQELGSSILGQYFLAVSVITWLAIAVKAGVPAAVTKRISANPDAANRFITTGAVMQLGLLAAVSAVLFAFLPSLESYLGFDYVYVFPVFLLGRSAVDYLESVLEGQHKVHLGSLLAPTNWISRVALQAGLVYFGWQLGGLLVGYVFGAFVAVSVGLVFVSYTLTKPDVETSRSLLAFSRYSWIDAFKGATLQNLDTIILGFFVRPSFIGIYEIAWNVSAIFSIFGDSVRQSMFPELSEAAENSETDRIVDYLDGALAFTGIFAIPGFVGVVVVGDVVLSIYGEEFVRGHTVLLILTVGSLFSVYASQFTSALNALNRPDRTFRIQAIYIGTNATLNVVLISQYGWTGAAVATMVAGFLGTVLGYRSLTDFVSITLPVRTLGAQLAAAVAMGVVITLLRDSVGAGIWTLALIVPAGVVIYFLTLLGISGRFRDAVVRNAPIALPWNRQ